LTVAVAVAVTVADIGAANAAVGDGAADMEPDFYSLKKEKAPQTCICRAFKRSEPV
jgi:hypothetical protein